MTNLKESMTPMPLTLDQVDADGAIRETMDAVQGDTRAAFLAKAGFLGGGLLGGSALLALMEDDALAQGLGRSDVSILNYALTLEYLEAAFYTEAVRKGALAGELGLFARVAGGHERAHVAALKRVLGRRAVKRPKFDFRGTTESRSKFRATAIVLEDTGVSAYAGQAPRVKADAVLEAALAIHTVEARHAAWIRDIAGEDPAPRAFDRPKSRRTVLRAVQRTGFIRG
jgi:hypothetical protein